eukprot:gb/GECH01003891.1/.p1 GENE.gb/GECH01003891.1/~~gb/GECH01003891.1/.p1  ORF type:complete len:402 (+),score=63.06 gb/GECH01003891.1/:1-1206(+)
MAPMYNTESLEEWINNYLCKFYSKTCLATHQDIFNALNDASLILTLRSTTTQFYSVPTGNQGNISLPFSCSHISLDGDRLFHESTKYMNEILSFSGNNIESQEVLMDIERQDEVLVFLPSVLNLNREEATTASTVNGNNKISKIVENIIQYFHPPQNLGHHSNSTTAKSQGEEESNDTFYYYRYANQVKRVKLVLLNEWKHFIHVFGWRCPGHVSYIPEQPGQLLLYPHLILDRLYLGSRIFADNKIIFHQLQIRYVVNATISTPNYFEGQMFPLEIDHDSLNNLEVQTNSALNKSISQQTICYQRVPVEDSSNADLLGNLLEVVQFIDQGLNYSNENCSVLIHCERGRSRSAAIVGAYLIWKYRWNVEEALSYVSQRRPSALPNKSFQIQLKRFAEELLN